MMVTGMNKGVMLKHLLQKTGRTFKAIIFMDDTRKNLNNVKESFNKDSDIDLTVFQYDKIIADRKKENGGVILTSKQANKMAKDWKKLNRNLNKIFPGRIEFECVSKQ